MDAIGVTIKDEFRIYMFIQRIDPFFETCASHLRGRMRDTTDREFKEDQLPFSLDAIISRLLDEHRAKSQSVKVGLLSKKSHQEDKPSTSTKFKRACSHCNKTRHSTEGCWHLHPENAFEGWQALSPTSATHPPARRRHPPRRAAGCNGKKRQH